MFIFLCCHEKTHGNKNFSHKNLKPGRESQITTSSVKPCIHAENATLLQFLSLESKMVQQRNMQLRRETNFLKNINKDK